MSYSANVTCVVLHQRYDDGQHPIESERRQLEPGPTGAGHVSYRAGYETPQPGYSTYQHDQQLSILIQSLLHIVVLQSVKSMTLSVF